MVNIGTDDGTSICFEGIGNIGRTVNIRRQMEEIQVKKTYFIPNLKMIPCS